MSRHPCLCVRCSPPTPARPLLTACLRLSLTLLSRRRRLLSPPRLATRCPSRSGRTPEQKLQLAITAARRRAAVRTTRETPRVQPPPLVLRHSPYRATSAPAPPLPSSSSHLWPPPSSVRPPFGSAGASLALPRPCFAALAAGPALASLDQQTREWVSSRFVVSFGPFSGVEPKTRFEVYSSLCRSRWIVRFARDSGP